MVPSPPEVGRWRRCKTAVTPRQAQRRCGPHERTARPAVDDRGAPAPGSPPHPAPPPAPSAEMGRTPRGLGSQEWQGRHPPCTNEQRPDEHDVVALRHPIQHDSLRGHVAQAKPKVYGFQKALALAHFELTLASESLLA